MPYTKNTWNNNDTNTPLNAARLNNLETQYDQSLADSKAYAKAYSDTNTATAVNKYYSVKDYGAVGDGTTNDTFAVQTCLNAAATAKVGVYFPPSRYLISTVNVPCDMELFGAGSDSIIVAASASASPISIQGAGEALVGTVTANVAAGATTIPISGSTGALAVGDLFVLYDNYLYDPNDGAAVSGELCEVQAITSTQITTVSPIMGSFAVNGTYTTGNSVTVHKTNMLTSVYIHDLAFDGRLDATQTPLVNMYYLRNSVFERLTCLKHGDTFISSKLGWELTFRDNVIRNLTDDLANLHYGYGIRLSNANNRIIIDGLTASNVRHSVTTTGGSKGISRNLIFNNIQVTDCTTAAGVDTHASTDNALITNCVVQGCGIGITVRGRNTTVIGNQIYNCTTGIRIAETIAAQAVIKSNTILNASVGVDCSDAVVTVTIQDNQIENFSLLGIRIQDSVTYLLILSNVLSRGQAGGMDINSIATRVFIQGNTFYDLGRNGAGTANGINSTTGTGGSGRFDITGNNFTQVGAALSRAVNVNRGTVVGNSLFGASAFGATLKWSVAGANQSGNNEYT